jgi:hypothetical protein
MLVVVVGFWLAELLLVSNCGCCIGSLTWPHSQALEPVRLLDATARLWPSMDLLPCRVCVAAGALSRLGKLFVLAAGDMFVKCEDVRCAFTSKCRRP